MAKKMTKNYPLGKREVPVTKVVKRGSTEQFRRDAVRTNSFPNDRPREPS